MLQKYYRIDYVEFGAKSIERESREKTSEVTKRTIMSSELPNYTTRPQGGGCFSESRKMVLPIVKPLTVWAREVNAPA